MRGRFALAATWLTLAVVITSLGAADNPPSPGKPPAHTKPLREQVLAEPFNLELIARFRAQRDAEIHHRREALQALIEGLLARLRDDNKTASTRLRQADASASIRNLAHAVLTPGVWRILWHTDEDSNHTDPQALCKVCGHTDLADCPVCGGDGYKRDEICPRCGGTGVVPCTHPIHHPHDASSPLFLSPQARRDIRKLIDIARYLRAGGFDWFSPDAYKPSPKLDMG